MSEKWMYDLAEIVHVKCQANLDNERVKLAEVRDNLSMVQAVLETWAVSGPMHPAAAELWRSVNAAARGRPTDVLPTELPVETTSEETP